MAVTSDAFTATDLSAVINEVWTPIVLEELFPKTVFSNFFRDLSEFATDGGNKFHVPDVFTNSFSIQTQSTQGNEVTTESVAQNDITLSVDTHRYTCACKILSYFLEPLTGQQGRTLTGR